MLALAIKADYAPQLRVSGMSALRPLPPERQPCLTFHMLENRRQAEALFVADHARKDQNGEWTAYFVETMVEYLLWQHRPSGVLSEDDLSWLIGQVADAPSPSTPALLFALVREMNTPPERLMALALKHAASRFRAVPNFVSTHPIFGTPHP
jgi:hypothetical protein